MRFVTWDYVSAFFRGASVAIVGSAPSCLENAAGFVDSHDIIVRINNYKTGRAQGVRTDCFYSFFGNSVRKTAEELRADGVHLCLCKLPNSQPLVSEWHERMGKLAGVDYRYIFRNRAAWWFCDTFIPDDVRFLSKFELLGKHQPTTGFAAILDVLDCEPASCYLTGFDGFTSGLHNVNEPWREKNTDDPIRHRPDVELAWIAANLENYPLSVDAKLTALIRAHLAVAA